MKIKPSPSSPQAICRRIAQLRLELHGVRGKAAFARQLGVSASTYDYYEADRVPPADLLVKIADSAGIDLRWLITGESGAALPESAHPVIRRAAALMAAHPDSAKPLAAFIDVLAEAARKFPPKSQDPPPGEAHETPADWIPVLGRSAAGVPRFWETSAPEGLTVLADLMPKAAGARRDAATASLEGAGDAQPAQLVTLKEATPEGVCEFVVCGSLKARHPDAFAVRIDGSSMAPDIAHGDYVILSASAPAVDSRPAVVQLAGQIGVTCKLFRREKDKVHLVSLAPEIAPQVFPAAEVLWALRVLAKVRIPGRKES